MSQVSSGGAGEWDCTYAIDNLKKDLINVMSKQEGPHCMRSAS